MKTLKSQLTAKKPSAKRYPTPKTKRKPQQDGRRMKQSPKSRNPRESQVDKINPRENMPRHTVTKLKIKYNEKILKATREK